MCRVALLAWERAKGKVCTKVHYTPHASSCSSLFPPTSQKLLTFM